MCRCCYYDMGWIYRFTGKNWTRVKWGHLSIGAAFPQGFMGIRDLAQICILDCIHVSQEKLLGERVASGPALVWKLGSRTVFPSDAHASSLHVKGRERPGGFAEVTSDPHNQGHEVSSHHLPAGFSPTSCVFDKRPAVVPSQWFSTGLKQLRLATVVKYTPMLQISMKFEDGGLAFSYQEALLKQTQKWKLRMSPFSLSWPRRKWKSFPVEFTASSFQFSPLSFPQATNQTLLDKFKRQHEGSSYIEFPAVMEPAFIIKHYAGKVKYGVKVCHPAVPQQLLSSESGIGKESPTGSTEMFWRGLGSRRWEGQERSVWGNWKVVRTGSSCSSPHGNFRKNLGMYGEFSATSQQWVEIGCLVAFLGLVCVENPVISSPLATFITGYVCVGLSIPLPWVLSGIPHEWFQSWPYFYSCQLSTEGILVARWACVRNNLGICSCKSLIMFLMQ